MTAPRTSASIAFTIARTGLLASAAGLLITAAGCASTDNRFAQVPPGPVERNSRLAQQGQQEFDRRLAEAEARAEASAAQDLFPANDADTIRPLIAARAEQPVTLETNGLRTNVGQRYEVNQSDAPPPAPLTNASIGPGTAHAAIPTPVAVAMNLPADQEIDQLVDQLANALRRTSERSATPVAAMIKLAPLELLSPGVFNQQFSTFERGSAIAVSPDDAQFLAAWRDFFARSFSLLDDDAVELDLLATMVDDLNIATRRWKPLEVADARLCTRVDGFGLYRELKRYSNDRYKFLAGRSHDVLVYVEVDNFQHHPARQDNVDGFAVELKQGLELFFAGTDRIQPEEQLLAWKQPEEPIVDFSRRRRSDFFIVQMVTLPKTLSVGRYRLKVALRDEHLPDAVAERFIEFDIVSDASALQDDTVANAPIVGR